MNEEFNLIENALILVDVMYFMFITTYVGT